MRRISMRTSKAWDSAGSADGVGGKIERDSNGYLVIQAQASQALALQPTSGNVGIGTSPIVSLDIANPVSSYIRLGSGAVNDNAIIYMTGGVQKFITGQRYQDSDTFRIQPYNDWGVTAKGFFSWHPCTITSRLSAGRLTR